MWRLANATQPDGGYVEQDDWNGFVASTVRHALGDMWRFRTRKPTASLDGLQEEQGDAYVPTAVSAEEAALALATEWQMFHAFTRAGIASRTAAICIRYYVHNQPYEEIVTDLGGTVGAARVAAHRAMKKMKAVYANNPEAIFNG
jgi:DNA-directed RNA polymerase specialized sigma24 family protein